MFFVPLIPIITLAAVSALVGYELFDKLYREHHIRMCRIANSILHNRSDAEDAVSSAYEKVWKHIESFEEKSDNDIKKLLTTYTVNSALDVQRNNNAKKNQALSLTYCDDDDREKEYEIPDTIDLDEILLEKEKIEEVRRCIDKLPDAYRQAIILRYRYRYPSKNIAEIMNISITAVDNRISRAKVKLLKMLEDYING